MRKSTESLSVTIWPEVHLVDEVKDLWRPVVARNVESGRGREFRVAGEDTTFEKAIDVANKQAKSELAKVRVWMDNARATMIDEVSSEKWAVG